MNIMELGALGEFLGSIAVIATLIYLAIQIRQNTSSLDSGQRLAQAQAYQSRAMMMMNHYDNILLSPDAPAILQKVEEQGVESLSADERIRYMQVVMVRYTHLDNAHFQHQQGFIDDEYYDSIFRFGIEAEGSKFLLLPSRPSFHQEVERILAAQGAGTKD